MENNIDVIVADKIKKHFVSYRKEGTGFLAAIRRKKTFSYALNGISFRIKKGTIVALLGKNGSGKSTMLKILSGVIHPDFGSANVLGMNPSKERRKLTERIGVMFGSQHLQLEWNLPPIDTYIFMKEIYGIPEEVFRKRLKYFIRLLGIEKVYTKPTRQLSLGERMKCELVASSLHYPEILFLDEPTVGVDLPSRNLIKSAIKKMRDENGMTIVITTHVVEDIADAERIIVFEKGRIFFDGSQNKLRSKFGRHINVTITTSDTASISQKAKKLGRIYAVGENYVRIKLKPGALMDKSFSKLLQDRAVLDFRITDQSLSDLLSALYRSAG